MAFSTDNLLAQNFTINADTDTILVGKSGTKIRIYKNSFVDQNGNVLKGIVDIELKEVFAPEDIVLGGLHTLSEGKMLQTGGMIYLDAKQNENTVELGRNKIIGLLVPTDSVLNSMQVFNGVADTLGIDWREPEAILNSFQWVVVGSDTVRFRDVSQLEKILKDSLRHDSFGHEIEVGEHSEGNSDPSQEAFFIQEIQQPKGTNIFVTDFNMNYIFTMKKLGWANIDRLYSDPRTADVEFITEIENKSGTTTTEKNERKQA